MRKLMLIMTALVLLALVLGVSYIKALRADSEQDAMYSQTSEELNKRLQDSLGQHRQVLDSVKQATAQQQLDFLTVINRAALQHRADIDSLSSQLERKDSLLDSISSRSQSTESDNRQVLSAKEQQRQREQKIIEHYKKRYHSLPNDLSAYERKVALGEIRSETADKFGLSMSELESLRKKYELTY
ncbi:hypothetical protein GF356_10595 [candidate division GN15 bacterium]|nr:hypothetical protein [candidate division GN15 bacterium]